MAEGLGFGFEGLSYQTYGYPGVLRVQFFNVYGRRFGAWGWGLREEGGGRRGCLGRRAPLVLAASTTCAPPD